MNVQVTKTFTPPAQKIWNSIRRFDSVNEYLPAVIECKIKGNQICDRCNCTLQEGMKLKEILEYVNDGEMVLKHSIDNGISPFENYLETATVKALMDRQTEVDWRSEFNVKGVTEADLRNRVEDLVNVHTLVLKLYKKQEIGRAHV